MNRSLVILTGAGISAESGLKTFRDQNGLWENHRVEDVASLDGFRRNPKLVQKFYNDRRAQLLLPDVKPNKGHEALVRLEQQWEGDFLLVTQNVDNLHEQAGSKNLIHMHGELLKVRCMKSEKIHDWSLPIEEQSLCPCCQKPGLLRPHIVWFGEMPLFMDEIYGALETCDIFASIGTSGNVYPAAGFVRQVSGRKIEFNRERSEISDAFDDHRVGLASECLPLWVDELLAVR